MSNGVDFKKLALGLRGELTAAQTELTAQRLQLARCAEQIDAQQDELAAAKSRESALREELQNQRDHGDERESELAALREELAITNRNLDETIEQGSRLRLRLTAAEQRNAQHEGMLRHFANCADVRQVGISAMGYVDALTKPTESGASDKCTCIRQPQEPQCTDCPNRKSGASA